MFFRVSKDRGDPDEILIDHYYYNGYHMSFDSGWSSIDNIFFRGYCLDKSLEEKVRRKDFTEKTGNYAIISLEEDGIVLYTSESRSFPIWYTPETISNIEFDGERLSCEDRIVLTDGLFQTALKY